MTDLKPCPFCGESEGEMVRETHKGLRRYQVFCCECYARGPWSAEERVAALAWNRRTENPNAEWRCPHPNRGLQRCDVCDHGNGVRICGVAGCPHGIVAQAENQRRRT